MPLETIQNQTQIPLWKRILPWLVCLGIFVYIFQKIDFSQVIASLRHANLTLLFSLGLFYFLYILIIDAFATRHFITRFSTPVTLGEIIIIRGVTYLMMILNYAAAQGIFAFYLKKSHQASIAKTLGTMFFITLADLLLVFTSALLALFFSNTVFHGINLKNLALQTVPLMYLGYILWILFWRHVDRPKLRFLKRYRLTQWILEHNLFIIFREAKFKDYVILFLYRLPIIVVLIASYNFALMSFHSFIDWIWIFLYNPIISFITALPITPAGLGTGQVLAIEFYKNLITSPLIGQSITSAKDILFASSLLWNLINQLYKALFGVICLAYAQKKMNL